MNPSRWCSIVRTERTGGQSESGEGEASGVEEGTENDVVLESPTPNHDASEGFCRLGRRQSFNWPENAGEQHRQQTAKPIMFIEDWGRLTRSASTVINSTHSMGIHESPVVA